MDAERRSRLEAECRRVEAAPEARIGASGFVHIHVSDLRALLNESAPEPSA